MLCGMSDPSPLAEFIDTRRGEIVTAWGSFARTLLPAAQHMSALVLKDHVTELLTAIVQDMRSTQTIEEQFEKSQGRGKAQQLSRVGELHAHLRIESGFKLGQMVSEYRALRASVLRLWLTHGTDPSGIARFNESIDEAVAQCVSSFLSTTEQFRDQTLGILGHELRDPLHVVGMRATLIARSKALDPDAISSAQLILQTVDRMSRTIRDLLDLTRTRFGHSISIVRKPIDVGTSVAR